MVDEKKRQKSRNEKKSTFAIATTETTTQQFQMFYER